jgi:hypothetical protein
MYKFKTTYDLDPNFLKGQLLFENYPVKISTLSNDYTEDKLIEAFSPFLKLEKPINKKFVFNFIKIDQWIKIDVYYPRFYEYDQKEQCIYLNLIYSENNLLIYYQTYKTDSPRITRKRSREDKERSDFLNNVLNAMARFANSIILDFSYMISEPFRSSEAIRNISTKTGRPTPFLGPAEKLVASFIGAPSLVKDGLQRRTEALKKRMEDPKYFTNLLSEKKG